jgi:hypothetical protein
MRDVSVPEPVTEKKCPVCGRSLARTYGPEIPCALCVRLGPPSVRCKQSRLKEVAILPHSKSSQLSD